MTPTFTDSPTLGRFTGPSIAAQIARTEELRAAYQMIDRLKADLEECAEYFKDRSDVNDGDYGEPEPNKEMRLYSMIQETLHGPGAF